MNEQWAVMNNYPRDLFLADRMMDVLWQLRVVDRELFEFHYAALLIDSINKAIDEKHRSYYPLRVNRD